MQTIPNHPSRILQIPAALFTVVAFAAAAPADIFQWEYINPADPSQGKQQSTTLAPDGSGVDAVPGANVYGRNLTMAYLIGANLTSAYGAYANLTDADLSQANLTNAYFATANLTRANFRDAILTNADFSWYYCGSVDGCPGPFSTTFTQADFTSAEIRGARFDRFPYSHDIGTGISLAQLYSTASYQAKDLSGVSLRVYDLTGGIFAGQNLTNASFEGATLTDADFAGAVVRGARFAAIDVDILGIGPDYRGTGITLAQLYSTASYQAHDLKGIDLSGHNLTNANFSGQNLTDANLGRSTAYSATLTGADFRDANLTGVGFYAADLTGANFRQAKLTNAGFYGAKPLDADFTDADVRGARFDTVICSGDLGCNTSGYGITLLQLDTTASYQAHDLSGIGLSGNYLDGGHFAGQNLTNASLVFATLTNADFHQAKLANANLGAATLTGANFREANLTNANFVILMRDDCGASAAQCDPWSYKYATSTNADLTAADARGARGLVLWGTATTANLIKDDGHIAGLVLESADLLVVRDYDGYEPCPGSPIGCGYGSLDFRAPIPPIPITIDQRLTMGPGGALRMVFEADEWNSTISFAPGIPVTLGGTLELTFAADVNPATQLGRTFHVFDWTGVTPTGAFTISSPYGWNLSNLHTTGEVTLTSVPEPPMLALVLPALCVIFYRRRRIR